MDDNVCKKCKYWFTEKKDKNRFGQCRFNMAVIKIIGKKGTCPNFEEDK